MSIALHGFNDRQHLLIVDLIVLLGGLKLATVKGDGMEYSVSGIALRDDGTECIVGSIRFEYRGKRRIEMAKDRGRSESRLELFKCSLSSGVPVKLASLLEKRCHWRSNLAEVFDETTIEVGETEENTNVVHRFGSRPSGNGAHFRWIHLHTVGTDDIPQKSHLLPVKLALTGLQIQSRLLETFQYHSHMSFMLSQCLRVNKQIVQIHD